MTVFIDTSVVMYAGGASHRHRDPCREVLRGVADGRLVAVTSTEVVQEILHRFATGQREVGVRMARAVLDLFGDLVAVDRHTIEEAVRRFQTTNALSARDALHVATCVVNGIEKIVTVDTDFDAAVDVRRIDPRDAIAAP